MVFYIDITVKEIFTAIQVWYANFISKEVVLLGAAGKFLEIYADLSLKVPIFVHFYPEVQLKLGPPFQHKNLPPFVVPWSITKDFHI